jgi:O-antigen ligase
MDPRLRTTLISLLACVLAVWIGISLAQEEHFIASVAALLSVWAVLSWTRGPLAEAWLLAFLVFGYVVGNRGFAQIRPVSGLPLFLSELGLGIVVSLVILRGAMSRFLPLRVDWLNGLLLLWLVLGAGRIAWDVRTHGFMALRDFATVYYVLYFFAAQALARHPSSNRLLHGSVLATFAVLPVIGLPGVFFPDFFVENLLIEGVPLIFYKGDLLATFLYMGYIILLPTGPFDWRRDGWRWLLAVVSLVLGLSLLSRAGMVGLLVAIAWQARAGRWRPARVLAGICAAALLGIVIVSLLQKKDFSQTRAYAVYEAVTSIADFSGTRGYRSDASGNKGDNNRFRLVWWRNVAEETLTTSPVFGLGFGADLARGFVQEYYPDTGDEFTARSPHNIFMTVLGRMGLTGVLVLLAFYVTQFRTTARTARAARTNPAMQHALSLQSACWVLLVSACFGVVLEGPMGAIPFWIILGLANHEAVQQPA